MNRTIDRGTGTIAQAATSGTTDTSARAPARPVVARPGDRWLRGGERGTKRLSGLAAGVLVVSLGAHLALVVSAYLGSHAHQPATQEIPVEIVREVPPPEPAAQRRPDPPAPARQRQAAAPPPAPPKPEPLKPEPPKPKDHDARSALERELAKLKAEQAALKSDDHGLGKLRDSIQAIAMPSLSADGEGEAVGYQAVVFSQLAKAKDLTGHMGRPGTTGVRFTIDAAGRLVDAEVAMTSGLRGLDDEALAIVRRAAPFPPPPPGAERDFSANVSFVARAAP